MYLILLQGDLSNGEDVLCRVHSECLTGDIFASARCDCGPQLHQAMQRISTSGRGVLIYLRGQEGRGIGIGKKLEAYNLQDRGRDTVEANQDLGLPVDAREYGVSADVGAMEIIACLFSYFCVEYISTSCVFLLALVILPLSPMLSFHFHTISINC